MKIVAFVDHSIYADSVCDHAVWLSSGGKSSIDIIHVINPYDMNVVRAGYVGLVGAAPSVVGNMARRTAEQVAELREAGQRLVDRMTERASASTGAIVVGRVAVGEWHDIIADIDQAYDVVVIGKRGEGADFVRSELGTTLDQLVRTIDGPALVVPRTYRRIDNWLVAFSPSRDVADGVERVARDQLLPPIPCTLLHAGVPDGDVLTAMQAASRQLTNAGYNVSLDTSPGPLVKTFATRIVKDEFGLLAMGGFHDNLFASFLPALFGEGTANELTRACLTPVLVLR